MFQASGAHHQEDTVVYMQLMLLSLSTRVRSGLSVHSLSENLPPTVSSHSSCVPTGHHELSYGVTVPYSACIQLYPPENEHLRLEICRGK